MHVSIYTYICMYIYTYICTHIYIYIITYESTVEGTQSSVASFQNAASFRYCHVSHVPCIWFPYLIYTCATTLSYFFLGLFVRIPSPIRSLGRSISKCCIFLVFIYVIWLVCSNACPMTHAHNLRDSFKCTPSPIRSLRRPIPTCCIFLVFV